MTEVLEAPIGVRLAFMDVPATSVEEVRVGVRVGVTVSVRVKLAQIRSLHHFRGRFHHLHGWCQYCQYFHESIQYFHDKVQYAHRSLLLKEAYFQGKFQCSRGRHSHGDAQYLHETFRGRLHGSFQYFNESFHYCHGSFQYIHVSCEYLHGSVSFCRGSSHCC